MDEQPASPEPRKLSALLTDSLKLATSAALPAAAVVTAGALPGFVLTTGVAMAYGLVSKESLEAALKAGEYTGPALLSLAGIVGRLFSGIAYMTLILLLNARVDGREAGPGEALGEAFGALGRMIWAEFLVILWMTGGLLLLIIPGLLIAIRGSMTHLAVLLEGRVGWDAYDRSKEIVQPHLGKIIGNQVVAFVVVAIAAIAATLAARMALAIPAAILGSIGAVATSLAQDIVPAIVSIWAIAFNLLLYRDLAALHPPAQAAPAPAPAA